MVRQKKQLRTLIGELRSSLATLRSGPDSQSVEVKSESGTENQDKSGMSANVSMKPTGVELGGGGSVEKLFKSKLNVEKKYTHNENKLLDLNHNLPVYKAHIKSFFEISGRLKSVFLQIDDFYHLNRTDQPFVADYIHRLCKDTPLKFKNRHTQA